MTTTQLAFWCGLMVLGFAGSALFSGMETGAYRLNRVRLFVRAAKKERGAILLEKQVDQPASLLATLLVGNNLANYLGTAALGMLLGSLALNEWQVVVVNTLLVSLLLLIFGETLPKDLFATHGDRLMPPLARMLMVMRWIFTALLILPAVMVMSRLAVWLVGGGSAQALSPRKRVVEMVRHGAGYGVLSDAQSAMAQRALSLSNQLVQDEATPWARVQTLRLDQDVAALKHLARQSKHSRFPIVDARGDVAGTIDLIDTLADQVPDDQPVKELLSPALVVPGTLTIRQVLTRLQSEHFGLAILTNIAGKPTGVVTVKDLIEPLTGEIRDW